MKITGAKICIFAAYLLTVVALGVAVIGEGALWAIIVANAALLLTYISGASGLILLWVPRQSRSLRRKLFGSMIALVPLVALTLLLIAVALRK